MLSERHLRLALFCVAEELRTRQRGKPPGPAPWLWELVAALKSEVALTHSRQSDIVEREESNHEHEIGTGQAAEALGWTRRRVQRRAADLNGRLVAGRYLFDACTIRGIAQEADGDQRNTA